MMTTRLSLAAVAAAAVLACAGCTNTNPTAADASHQVVDDCANSALASKAVLYFGPSNQIGPGSVWAQLGALGGYQPMYRLQDLAIAPDVIQPGQPFECDLTHSRGWKADGALSVLSGASVVSADAKADFARATAVVVSTKDVAWDELVMGPYGAKLRSIADPVVRADVSGPARLTMRRALRVGEYKVALTFDSTVAPTLQAKYQPGVLPASVVGNAGAKFSVAWSGHDKLELTARDIYLAGEFVRLVDGQWQSGRGAEVIDDLQERWIRPLPAR